MEKQTFKNYNQQNRGVSVVNSQFYQQPKWITIKGILTSQLRSKPSSDTPYYAFAKLDNSQRIIKHSNAEICANLKCQECEIPVIFRIKKLSLFIKPNLNKGDLVELTGYFAEINKPRASFTVYNYQIIAN